MYVGKFTIVSAPVLVVLLSCRWLLEYYVVMNDLTDPLYLDHRVTTMFTKLYICHIPRIL